MYIAHSNINPAETTTQKEVKPRSEFAEQIALKLFKKACKENEDRIKRIQEYFPGWTPKFNRR